MPLAPARILSSTPSSSWSTRWCGRHSRIGCSLPNLSMAHGYTRAAAFGISVAPTQFVDPEHRDLAPGEVRFDIDFVALTSNNVTYAVAGDLLDYWGFFPVGLPWGHVPAMGYGTVIESANGDVKEGARHFGFFPMADQHLSLIHI